MRTAVAAVLGVALVAAPTEPTYGASASADPALTGPYAAAISRPQEDSYYPSKGDPRIDALQYDLNLSWHPEPRRLDGVATIRFRVTRDTDGIQLDFGDPLRVRRLRLDGEPVPYDHPGHHLAIRTAPLAGGSQHTLRIAYSGTPKPIRAPSTRSDLQRVGWTTTRDGRVWTMQEPFGALTWYPVNDHPSDKALYKARISVPKRWVGVFNGKLLLRRTAKGRTVTSWHLGSPASSYLITIAIGPYQAVRDTGPHGLPLTSWVRPGSKAQTRIARDLPSLLRWLESRLGRYPFHRAGIVFVPSPSAMETQTLVTFGTGRIWRWDPFGTRATVLHELAHQWYGDTVTPGDWRDMWLNEGFAMYIQILWESTHGGWSMKRWVRLLRQWDQPLRREYGPPGAYDRRQFGAGNVYYCPALMLHELRRELGSAEFLRLLRAWPQQHELSNQSRASYIRWLEKETGRRLGPFVRDWLMSPRTPR